MFRALLIVLISLPLAGCAPASLILRAEQELGSRLRSPSGGLAAPRAQPAPDGSVEAAIQDVIQRANTAQEEAIASRDPSGMKDTATERYYREIMEVNEDLLAAGISNIRLVEIEWGPISVTGDVAIATAYETWRVTLRDGRSRQSRDRNVYRLVRENGGWKIESDDHPDEPSPLPPGIQIRAPAPAPRSGTSL
jgi:ketosteroid isomerase-like protein